MSAAVLERPAPGLAQHLGDRTDPEHLMLLAIDVIYALVDIGELNGSATPNGHTAMIGLQRLAVIAHEEIVRSKKQRTEEVGVSAACQIEQVAALAGIMVECDDSGAWDALRAVAYILQDAQSRMNDLWRTWK